MSSQIQRIGGFVAYNTGRIEDCCSNVRLRADETTGGFCGENRGSLENCFSRGSVRAHGRILRSGLCAVQNGRMEGCFWVCNDKKQGEEVWRDWDRAVPEKELAQRQESLTENWDRSRRWSILPDEEHDRVEIELLADSVPFEPRPEVVEISDAKGLRALAAEVNNGRGRTDVLYRLTRDIDLRGAVWTPIGMDPNFPFTGCFDGAGHTVSGFRIRAGKLPHAGFFGCVSVRGEVRNLKLDCILEGKGEYVGALAAINYGAISNCVTRSNCNAARYAGCFVAQNNGLIQCCTALGRISAVILFPWWVFTALLIGLLLIPTLSFMLLRSDGPADEVFAPVIIDPNARPIDPEDPTIPTPDPEDLTDSSACFIMNAEMAVNRQNYAGVIGLRCPVWSTKGFVATVTVSGDQLKKYGASYTEDAVLFKSGLIAPNTGIDVITLDSLPDGSGLPAGDYQFIVLFDFYDPETNERAAVNSNAPIDVTVR